MPLIQDYIAEHDHAVDVSAEAIKAMDAGDHARTRELLGQLAENLKAHWKGEEEGLFRQLLERDLYEDHIRPLIEEHRALEKFLAEVDVTDPAQQQRLRDEVLELREHILKEEDGIFPASITALDGTEWDAAISAWHDAHPGADMISHT